MRRFSVLLLAFLLMGITASALSARQDDQAGMDAMEITTITCTIDQIDQENRTVTLKASDGRTRTVHVPEEFDRFDSLRVGDKVTARFAEAVALSVGKAGEPPDITAVEEARHVPGGAEVEKRVNVRVQVKSVDAEKGTLTVLTPEGEEMELRVDDTQRLRTLQPGDDINVTYTVAMLLEVEHPEERPEDPEN